MRIKRKLLLVLPLTAIMLGGCIFEKQEIGEIPLPPKEAGNLHPLNSALYPVDSISIIYQAGFEVREAEAMFAPKGIIKGISSPMVPLDNDGSDLDNLGFITYLSLDGRAATLTYREDIIQVKEGDKSFFLNNEPGVLVDDAPIFNNSTLYIPIIPILQMLDIHYEIEGNRLVIGEQYTDDAEYEQSMQTTEISTQSPTLDDVTEEDLTEATEDSVE